MGFGDKKTLAQSLTSSIIIFLKFVKLNLPSLYLYL